MGTRPQSRRSRSYLRSPNKSCNVSSSAWACTSSTTRVASVFALSVVNVFDLAGAAAAAAAAPDFSEGGAEFLDVAGDDEVVVGVAAPDAGGEVTGAGAAAGAGAGADVGGVGLLPPILSVMVGGGFGASSCIGRSMGAGGGCAGWPGWVGGRNLPGTNSAALKFSLLIVKERKRDRRERMS